MCPEQECPPIAKILVIAIDDEIIAHIKDVCPDCEFEFIKTREEFEEKFEDFHDGTLAFMICGSALGIEYSFEVAQIIRNQCPKTPSYYVSQDKSNFVEKTMLKNGFSKAYLFPLDVDLFKETIIQDLSPENLKKRFYKNIRVVDLNENTNLGFDTYVFLPLNKKHVLFTSKDQTLSEKKLEKLKESNKGNLQIDQKDLPLFYEYTANHLKDLASGTGPLSETERQEKLKESIRGLFTEIFDQSTKTDFSGGKEMLENCQNIVSTYVTGNSKSSWYNQLISAMGGKLGGYDHAANVSTFAALFAIGMQHPHPEDLALAGFLHDLALSDFPDELRVKPESEWPKDLLKIYHEHPQQSVNLIKQRKMIVSAEVEKAILQHHEMFNGKGFPKGLMGERIFEDAQILSLANQFSYLSSQLEGQKNFTPSEVLDKIAENGSIGTATLRKVRMIFKNEPKD